MFLKPHFSEPFSDHYLLWFDATNSYSWVDEIFYEFLLDFFESDSEEEFIEVLQSNYGCTSTLCKEQYERIANYLNSFVSEPELKSATGVKPQKSKQFIKQYAVGSYILELSFDKEQLLELVHPIIAHLEAEDTPSNDLHINIRSYEHLLILQEEDEQAEFFKASDYHKLQGRLLLYIINLFHQVEEQDWMGFFHASAVSKDGIGYLFIGSSGSGKSTLVSLLSAHGFKLVADDAVPVRASDQKICTNPAAVSVKEKSLPIVSSFWTDRNTYTTAQSTKGKGGITYIPMHNPMSQEAVPCPNLIKVSYQKNQPAQLSPLNTKTALETLIPESWISPEPENAASFINWIKSVQFFELTYSNFKEALELIEDLN